MNNKIKFIIAILGIIVIAAILFFQTLSIKNLTDKIDEEKQLLSEEQDRLVHFTNLKKSAELSIQRIRWIESILPSSQLRQDIIETLHETSHESMLYLSDLRFSDIQSKEKYSKIPFTLELTGDYNDYIKFFDKLNNNSRLYRIDTLQLRPVSGSPEKLSGTIRGFTFYR